MWRCPKARAIAIVPGPGVRWQAVLPTLVRAGEPFRLALKADDKWGNPSDQVERDAARCEPSAPIAGLPATRALRARQLRAPSSRG